MFFIKALTTFLLLPVTLTTSTLITTRSLATIQAELKNITLHTQNYTSEVKKWDGTTGGAVGMFQAKSALITTLYYTKEAVKNEPILSCPDSNTTNTYIKTTLEPATLQSAQEMISRKQDYINSKYQGVAAVILKDFRYYSKMFFGNYSTKVCASANATAQGLASKIDGDWAMAAGVFQ